MADWTQCPSCLLKHVARPDGLCPRCRHPISVAGWGEVGAPPAPPPAAVAFPPAPAAQPAQAHPAAFPAQTYPAPAVPPAHAAGMAAAPYAFTVGRFISGTFGTWARTAVWVVPLALLAYTPAAVGMYRFYSGLAEQLGRAPNPFAIWRGLAAPIAMVMLVMPLLLAAIARAGVRRLRGEPVGLGDMLGTAFRSYFPAFGLLFLVGAAWILSSCTLVVPLMLATAWAASLPALISEGLGPVEALKRSWELSRGLRWQVFAGFLVVELVLVAASCLLQGALTAAVLGAVAAAGGHDPRRVLGTMSVMQATNMLLQGVYYSVLTVGTSVAYHQLRVAAEGPPAQALGQVFE